MIDVGYEVELQYECKGFEKGSIGTVASMSQAGLGGRILVEFPDPDGQRGDVRSVWVPDGAVELA